MKRYRLYKRIISELIIFIICALTLSGCLVDNAFRDGNTIGGRGGAGTQGTKAPVFPFDITYGRIPLREKPVFDLSTERFSVSGDNAFYILPGLCNLPAAMATFQVLDYNSRGEFVYFYVTPSYIAPDEVMSFETDPLKNKGTVSKNTVPDIFYSEDYEYDAEILMAYNPDEGYYHVMEARAYKIEFDPEKEGRPYFYEARFPAVIRSGSGGYADGSRREHIFVEQRGFACRIAEREEYFLFDQSGIGTIYDVEGKVLSSTEYVGEIEDRRAAFDNQYKHEPDSFARNNADQKGRDSEADRAFEEWQEENGGGESSGSSDTGVSALITDAVMSVGHEGFFAITYFTGNSPFNPESRVRSQTLMSMREDVGGGSEGDSDSFISVNLKAEEQLERWMSLDGKFFNSLTELQKDENFDINELKATYCPDEYSPFVNGIGDDAAIITGSLGFINQEIDRVNIDDFTDIMNAFPIFENERRWIIWFLNGKKAEEYGGVDFSDGSFMWQWNNGFTLGAIRAFRSIHSLITDRKLKEALEDNDNRLSDALKVMADSGLLPTPGKYAKLKDGTYGLTGVFDTPAEKRQESLQVVKVLSENGVYSTFTSFIDYFPEDNDGGVRTIVANYKNYSELVPEEYLPKTERTVYYKDENRADSELSLLLRTFWRGVDEEDIRIIRDYLRGETGSKELIRLRGVANLLSSLTDNGLEKGLDEAVRDAEDRLDDGDISEDEYFEISDSVEELKEEKSLEEEIFDGAVKDVLEERNAEIEEFKEAVERIPAGTRERALTLCAGFLEFRQVIEADSVPVSYKLVFPEGTGFTIKESGRRETIAGKLFPTSNGVIVTAKSNLVNDQTELVGFQKSGGVFIYDPLTYGDAVNSAELEFESPSDRSKDRDILAVRTSKGVRFFDEDPKRAGDFYSGFSNANFANDLWKNYRKHAEEPEYKERSNYFEALRETASNYINYTYFPILFTKDISEEVFNIMYSELMGTKNYMGDWWLETSIRQGSYGFLTDEMLLTSSGYTREAEGIADEAAEAEKKKLEEGSGDSFIPDSQTVAAPDDTRVENKRMVGHLIGAEALTMIAHNEVLLCTVGAGTKILNLDTGLISDDMKGTYFRLFKRRYPGKMRGDTYKLIGFEEEGFPYQDTDLAMAKVYTRRYSESSVDERLIDSFEQVLNQFARDYIHREYRTRLDDNGELQRVERTPEEAEEDEKAEAMFLGNFLKGAVIMFEMAGEYGISGNAESLIPYLVELRERVAAVKPAISSIYKLAGGQVMLTSKNGKRDEAYWKNLESRMTLAVEQSDLEDIMIEIRMHDEVLPSLKDREQAEKYKGYKELLDFTDRNENAADLFREEELPEDGEVNETEKYRQDVLNDIKYDYFMQEFPEEMTPDLDKDMDERDATGVLHGETLMETEARREAAYAAYIQSLLHQVNPDSFVTQRDDLVDDFVDTINHGPQLWKGAVLSEEKKLFHEKIQGIDAVWKMEELIIREKIRSIPSYQKHEAWYEDYSKKISAGELMDAVGTSSNGIAAMSEEEPLSGIERVRALRQSDAYREIIGDIRDDAYVKEILKNRKQTWDGYVGDVITTSGPGYVKNDRGEIE